MKLFTWGHSPEASPSLVVRIAEEAGRADVGICKVLSNAESVAVHLRQQVDVSDQLHNAAGVTVRNNYDIAMAARHACEVALHTSEEVSGSRETIDTSLRDIHELAADMTSMEQ